MTNLVEYYHPESSLINEIEYDYIKHEMTVRFHKQDWQHDSTYIHIMPDIFLDFKKAESAGKFYLQDIKPYFQTKKSNNMATAKKQFDKVFDARIDVTKINKDWFFQGEKGVYMDVTVFYSDTPDEYKTNGFITQKVPKEVWEKDRNARGAILGGCKNWETQRGANVDKNAVPGAEDGMVMRGSEAGATQEWADDLPF